MEKAQAVRKDAASDYVAGVGVDAKRQETPFTQEVAETLYRTEWLARNVVDMYAEDMTAGGIVWKMDADRANVLEREFRRLHVWERLTDAIRWARLYGGSIITIETQDGQTETALPQAAQVVALRVFDRHEAKPNTSVLLSGANVGLPSQYSVSPKIYAESFKVDASRVLRFIGSKLPNGKAHEEDLWGESVLRTMRSSVSRYSASMASTVELIKRCYLRFLGVQNFWSAMVDDDPSAANGVGQAIKMINEVQNISGLTVADAQDVFQSQQYGFGGLKDVLGMMAQDNSGAADVPLVRLFGMSPSGFSTGDADLRNYYDRIARAQEDKLRDPINRLAEVILRSNGLKTDGIDFDFVPLAKPSESEKLATTTSAVSTVLQVYDAGLITADRALEEIRRQKDVSGLFATVTNSDVEKLRDVEPPQFDLSDIDMSGVTTNAAVQS